MRSPAMVSPLSFQALSLITYAVVQLDRLASEPLLVPVPPPGSPSLFAA